MELIKRIDIISLIIVIFSYSGFSQSYSDFEISFRRDSTTTYLMAYNQTPSSITLKISSIDSNQVYKKHIIPSHDSLVIFKKTHLTKETYLEQINKKYKFSYNFGDSLSSKHNDDYLYDFPFRKGKRYELIQSWGGKFSHSDLKSFHALDFKMKIGEPVHAAKSGIVVRSIEEFTENGGRALKNFANVIIIKHEDGTFAYYYHLKPEGSLVEVGQRIERGELIGLSGNTGFSTRPHLHFVVSNGNGNSIPIYFKGYKNKKLKPRRKYKK